MPTLTDATLALGAARAAADPAALAVALIDHAEALPLLRYRAAPAREELVEASRLLPPLGRPDLEARCLLRLAEVRMQEGLLDQAEALCDQAAGRSRGSGDASGVFQASCLRARLVRRRASDPDGGGLVEEADRLLAEVAGRVGEVRRADLRSFTAVSLALGEAQIDRGDEDAILTLRALLTALDREGAEALDARFQAHQGVALVAELHGHPDQALIHLRAAVTLVKAQDAPMDLLECRLALGTALLAARKTAEARRVLQVVVDDARDLQAEQHRLLGLTALSRVLADQGAVKGAVDLALESVTGYGRQGNLLGYVRGATLAAHALLAHGRAAAALELLFYGVAALRHTLGEGAAALLQAQVDTIREELGEERYEAVCQEVLELRAARRRLREE